MSSSQLDSSEVKKLTNVINDYIASQTSSALSTLLSEPVDYKVMILDKKYFNPNSIKLASDEIKMCGVKLSGKGDIHIEICYAIKMKNATKIAGVLMGDNNLTELDDMSTSALQEVANIMTGSFFNAMSLGTGFRVELSTPDYLQSDYSTLVNSTKDIIDSEESKVIIADAELIGKKSGIRIHMLIMQNPLNARKLVDNHNKKSENSEFSSIGELDSKENNSFKIGSENAELDALLEEFKSEEAKN